MNNIDFSVIDQMFSAQLSMNQSKEQLDALRPKVEAAVRELLRQQGKPADFTGVIEYHGMKIRIQRPTSYTRTARVSSTGLRSPSSTRSHRMP